MNTKSGVAYIPSTQFLDASKLMFKEDGEANLNPFYEIVSPLLIRNKRQSSSAKLLSHKSATPPKRSSMPRLKRYSIKSLKREDTAQNSESISE